MSAMVKKLFLILIAYDRRGRSAACFQKTDKNGQAHASAPATPCLERKGDGHGRATYRAVTGLLSGWKWIA